MRVSERVSRWLHRFVLPLVVGAGTFLAGDHIAGEWPAFSVWEANIPVDPVEEASPANVNIRVVLVSKETLVKLKGDLAADRLPRAWFARFVRGLHDAGAKTLLLDVVFSSPMEAEDRELRGALRAATGLHTTLVTEFYAPKDGPKYALPAQTEEGVEGSFKPNAAYEENNPRVALASAFCMGAENSDAYLGAIPVQRDRDTGRLRLHAAVEAARQHLGLDAQPILHGVAHRRLSIGSMEWELQGNQGMDVVWPRRDSHILTYEFAEALKMLEGSRASEFAGKIVVVGYDRFKDEITTLNHGKMAGPAFMANMIHTVLLPHSFRPKPAPDFVTFPIFSATAGLAFAFGFSRRAAAVLLGVAALCAVAWILPEFAARAMGLTFARVGPMLAIFASAVVGLLAAGSRLFRDDHRPEGIVEEATALFLDVRGSTRMLDEHGLERSRTFVNDLISECGKVIESHGGHVERVHGDGLLAIFRPNRPQHHAIRAADAASAARACAEAVAVRRGMVASVGIGFETGIVSGGYVTERGQRAWSSAGKAVNLAARLQAASESLGEYVVVGPVAARLIEEGYSLRPLGSLLAKGFTDHIPVFAYDLKNLKKPGTV